ncbi:glycoside hydrolase family 127 protein [Macroventuria anomochaeta]|uniref:Glycoside hydrolase family 127 protein n=1 Tax=Macroventuria anomochaeta TaxID=301207 RepID=A0ACB6SEU5_9PLEO|nr:glycoside hydrolase family 127 protein [Macroventuria anomochaeta]KAF2632835.1 glycoside hydrolase family 127 protein [Macroventuria anomochaeta]
MLQYDLNNKYEDIMGLYMYNAVFTAMSIDCTQFTDVNQLASSENNLFERCGWFTVCCCPPNVLRIFGMIEGYILNLSKSKKSDVTQIDVHLYAPATLGFETDAGPASLSKIVTGQRMVESCSR